MSTSALRLIFLKLDLTKSGFHSPTDQDFELLNLY